jgi:hypothetical protein
MAINLRTVKGTALTYVEADTNFSSLIHSASQSGNHIAFHTTGSVALGKLPSTSSINIGLGSNTVASGLYSHAEGGSTVASETFSHAEGFGTIASAQLSHAEGYSTISSGNNSHAEGESTVSSGRSSHAEGNITKAVGDYSHAEGYCILWTFFTCRRVLRIIFR